jgi:hypothetical protein
MVRGRGVFGFGLAVGVLLFGARSHAQEAAPPAKNVEFSVGLMGLVGGNYVTTPDNIPPGIGESFFAGDAGGFGWGFAAYGEGRFLRHLGVTLTLGYDRSMIQREITYNDVVTVNEKLSIGSPRLGLMAKGILPTPFGRLWLGIGPQFVLSTSSDAENEITSGRQFAPPPLDAQIENAINAEETKSTLLDLGLGLAVHAGKHIEIPFQIIASKNMSQENNWAERVTLNPDATYDVKTQSSWEFRMGIGVGARF